MLQTIGLNFSLWYQSHLTMIWFLCYLLYKWAIFQMVKKGGKAPLKSLVTK